MRASLSPSSPELNKLDTRDRAVHDWYRFVLSFPPHLVRQYLEQFGIGPGRRVLDPFCGTGTVLVECKKLGIASVGIEANPMAHFASSVKIDWTPEPADLRESAERIAEQVRGELRIQGVPDDPFFDPSKSRDDVALRTLDESRNKLLLTDSISPRPLHKALVLLDCLRDHAHPRLTAHERLALAKAAVFRFSNLQFGPEVGVGPPKGDVPVVAPWIETVRRTTEDLALVQDRRNVPSVVHHADARKAGQVIEPGSIDAVITSPPYPNEKDYTRTTRLESVLLGFIHDRADLRALKKGLVRSNTRGVYVQDDDDRWIAQHPNILSLADEIERRRIEMGKTSGFERMYARVTRLYFGGMARHLADLRVVLRPGARLAYVVGDQASYLRVMIRTGQLLAQIGEGLGYQVEAIDLFRTRLATATREQLREEVVRFRWPGA